MMRHDIAAMQFMPQVREMTGAWVTFPYKNYKLQEWDLGMYLVFWSVLVKSEAPIFQHGFGPS